MADENSMRIELWNFSRFFGADSIDMESNMTGVKSKYRWAFKCKCFCTLP